MPSFSWEQDGVEITLEVNVKVPNPKDEYFLAYKQLFEAPVWSGALPADAWAVLWVQEAGGWKMYRYQPNPTSDPDTPPQIPPGSSGLDSWLRSDGTYILRSDGGKSVRETQS